METRIENNRLLMMVTPPKIVAPPKDLAIDASPEKKKHVTVLENRKEIKSHTQFRKGMLIDLYV